ncbi:HlyD family efflux transporter periplasmic adaptor subunit [Paraburkholderia xenovorans]|uniref:HlyD family secretion protein n=1 Tax=Paraburkholderia xenovorans TaxID=36873 RepID=UPI0038B919FA
MKLQRTKLNTALVSRAELNEAQWHGLQMRAGQMKSQLAEVDEEKLERQRQIVLARQQLEKIQLMHDKGYASNTQLEQQEDTVLSAEGRLRELARQRLETEQQLSAITQQLRELPLNTRNEHDEIERKLADLDQAIVENESRRETILRAPENAVVAALLAKPGQTIGAGQTAVTLLPAGAKLEAQLMVPSRAIGFIRRDERVVLRYQAYPYQKFGQQYGRVSEVSRTALSPQEVRLLTGQPNVVEQQYRVVVALDRQDIMAYGNAESLRSGMALEADILIDTRSLIEWVLEPIVAIGRRMSS